MGWRVGIDTGGTFTDVVAYELGVPPVGSSGKSGAIAAIQALA